MPLSARALNRATLARQLLLERAPLDVPAAVHRVVAIQAQEPASPYLALWNRVEGFDPADLDRAFATQAVVKGSSVRFTLHAVHAGDHPAIHEAMLPRLRESGLDARFRVARSHDPRRRRPRPRGAGPCGHAALERRDGGVGRRAARRARATGRVAGAPLVRALRARTDRRPVVVRDATDVRRALPTRTGVGDPEHALAHLMRRYLEGFGPASVVDVAKFSIIQRTRIRAAIEALGDEVVRVAGPAKEPLYDIAGAPLPAEDTPAPPRLLGMWEETLLAYDDRSRIVPEAYRKAVIRVNGDVLPTLLVDGFVAGVWRPVEDGIEATAFGPLDEDAWAGLDAEARSLRAFLADREPLVYRRYGHWWSKLPEGTVRILGR